MSLRRFATVVPALVILLSVVLAAQTPAPNVSGNWKGAFKITIDDQPPKDDTAFMVFKQTGTELTGTAGPNENEQMPISKGKVETVKGVTTLTFEITAEAPVPVVFELKLVDGHLKGTAKAEFDGRKFRADIDVERAK
jgi:hypothetical protein